MVLICLTLQWWLGSVRALKMQVTQDWLLLRLLPGHNPSERECLLLQIWIKNLTAQICRQPWRSYCSEFWRFSGQEILCGKSLSMEIGSGNVCWQSKLDFLQVCVPTVFGKLFPRLICCPDHTVDPSQIKKSANQIPFIVLWPVPHRRMCLWPW